MCNVLARVRRYRNVLSSPIHRLNDDCVAHILRFIASQPRTIRSVEQPYAWVATVSSVCYYWRKLSLGFPSIWSVIDSRKPQMAWLGLRRSKKCPLIVFIHPKYSKALFDALASNAYRIQELDTTSLPLAKVVELLARFDEKGLPLLNSLFVGPGEEETPAPNLVQVSLPDLRLVRRFSLSHFSITGWATQFGNLTELTLRHDDPETSLNFTSFLNLLEVNPNLQCLSLFAAVPRGKYDVKPKRLVTLPNLQRLVLADCTRTQLILAHISIPSGAHLHISCVNSPHSTGAGLVAALLPSSLDHIHNLRPTKMLKYEVRFNPKLGNLIEVIHGSGPNGSFTIETKCLALAYPIPQPSLNALPESLVEYLSEFRMERFGSTTDGRDANMDIRMPIYKCMVRLESLALISCHTDRILRELVPKEDEPILFPTLRIITISEASNVTLRIFGRLALARKSRGASPLERVVFSNTSINSLDLPKLRKLVHCIVE